MCGQTYRHINKHIHSAYAQILSRSHVDIGININILYDKSVHSSVQFQKKEIALHKWTWDEERKRAREKKKEQIYAMKPF